MTTNSDSWMECREGHYQKFLGPIESPVMHSTDEKVPHIDIYQFGPTDERDFWTLITGGMSDVAQRAPELDPPISGRTEILLYAPEPQPWMFSVLKGLAGMPFDDDTYLHWGHTVPNGQPMTAKPSLLTSFFFLPPYFEDDGFDTLTLDDERVDILWLVPITEAEREFAVENGSRALEEVFAEKELPRGIDEGRASLV